MKISCVCVILALGLTIAAGSHAANILENPGFEIWVDTLGGLMPSGWFTNALEDPYCAYRSDHAHGGSYSLALANTWLAQGIAVTSASIVGGTHYDFSIYYDVPAAVGNAEVVLSQHDSGGALLGDTILPLIQTSGWEQLALGIDAEGLAVSMGVMLTVPADTVFFDDVVLDGLPGTGIEERMAHTPSVPAPVLSVSPNPCRNRARIEASLRPSSSGTLKIYDTAGRLVRKMDISERTPVLSWDCRDYRHRAVPSGVYFFRLSTASGVSSRRLIVLR